LPEETNPNQYTKCDRPLYESDKWRWDMMLKNDNILYIDWDLFPLARFTFSDSVEMVYLNGQPDNCLIYSPSQKIFWAYEDERIKRGIAFETHGWFRKVLRDKTIGIIPEETYKHLRTSGYSELKKQYLF